MVHGVEGVRAPAPAHRDHGRPDLSPKQSVIGQADETGAVEERFHLGAHVREVGRASEDYGMGGKHTVQTAVEDVQLYAAPAVLRVEAPVTRRASLDHPSAKLNEFRLPTRACQRL